MTQTEIILSGVDLLRMVRDSPEDRDMAYALLAKYFRATREMVDDAVVCTLPAFEWIERQLAEAFA